MAVVLGTPTTDNPNSLNSSRTISFDAGGNPILVRVSLRGSHSAPSATFNGVSMVSVVSVTNTVYSGIFYLASTPTGAQDLIVSFGGSCASVISIQTITGGGTPNNTNTATGDSSAPSVVITSETGAKVVDCLAMYSNHVQTEGGGQTSEYNLVGSSSSNPVRGCGSNEAGAASTTMSWGSASSDLWALCGCSIPLATPSGLGFWAFAAN